MTPGPGRGAVADTVVVLGTLLVLGVLGGVLWWLAVDPAQFTKAPGGAAMRELELSKRFSADGWYSVIALVAGFLAGLTLTWWRRRDYRLTTMLLAIGSVPAAATMSIVGRLLGPDAPDSALAAAQQGDAVPSQLEVLAFSSYLMWPIGLLVGAVMVLWSSTGLPGGKESVSAGERQAPAWEPEDRGRTVG